MRKKRRKEERVDARKLGIKMDEKNNQATTILTIIRIRRERKEG